MSEERQTNYTVSEGYELPSKGLIYDKKVDPRVELRSMTARDEMKRLNPSTTPLKSLADIIEGCMIEKPAVHVYDMALADYDYLLHKLRVVTYGPDYAVVLRCPECGDFIETTADLDSLSVREFDANKVEEYKTFSLPRCGRTVTIKFLTPALMDEIEIKTKEMQRKYKTAGVDWNIFVKLRACIDLVDGNKLGVVDMEQFINNLEALDMTKILNNIDRLNSSFGLDTEFTVDCPHCGGEVHTSFRYGPEFFRPTNV